MTEECQDAVLGKAVRIKHEAEREMGILRAEAKLLAAQLSDVCGYLQGGNIERLWFNGQNPPRSAKVFDRVDGDRLAEIAVEYRKALEKYDLANECLRAPDQPPR